MDDLWIALSAGGVERLVSTALDIARGCKFVLASAEPDFRDVGRSRYHVKTALKAIARRQDLSDERRAALAGPLVALLVRVQVAYSPIESEYVSHLQRSGATDKIIRRLACCCQSTLSRRRQAGAVPRKYVVASDEQVEAFVAAVKQDLPAAGRGIVHGALVARGIRIPQARLRSALRQVDPEGVQRRQKTVRKKRIYHNRRPDAVYHIDGNHKLCEYCIRIRHVP